MTNEMSDMSEIEAGKVKLTDERFLLQKLLEEIQDTFIQKIRNKNLDFRIQLLDDCHLISDRRRLKQILMNLVDNAVKFTEKGSITIVGDTTRKRSVILTVADTGIGIKKEEVAVLFNPRHRPDLPLKQTSREAGMRLYLSQKLARLMGGEITVESLYGKGSRFSLFIPRKRTGSDADGRSAVV